LKKSREGRIKRKSQGLIVFKMGLERKEKFKGDGGDRRTHWKFFNPTR